MIVAVNTRMLLKGRLDGIGTFSYETLKRMTERHREHHFVFFFDRPHDDSFVFGSNVTPLHLFPPARHPLLWLWWFELAVPRALRKTRAQVFLSPDGHLSLGTNIPSLAVIHDLNFEHYPNDMPWAFRRYYRACFPRFARKARRLATVSAFSRKDLCDTYGVAPEKIDVVGNAAGEGFRPLPAQRQDEVRQSLTAGAPYFLFVSTLHKRKNVVNTIRAFNRFKESTGSPMHFVFAGSRKWWTRDMEEAVSSSPWKHHLVFTGRLTESRLQECTAAAFAAVYVSVFEGFGIPVLEAMQCRVPVITSGVTALPEVAGGAALLCDPFSVDSIAGAMNQLAGDEALAARLRAAGEKRAGDFNWDKTAAALWDSLERTVTL